MSICNAEKRKRITNPYTECCRITNPAERIEVLQEAYNGTHELMDNGKASYLEVLTAQESLLNAQLSEAMNMYKGAQAVIGLYIALGGGTK
jgi:outer membrane protein TolC